MNSLPRFYLPAKADFFQEKNTLALTKSDSRHCQKVLRLQKNDCIEIFDGRGNSAIGRIAEIDKQSVSVILESVQQTPPPRTLVTLIQAIPKGKRFETVLQKSCELGANAIQPIISKRTISQPRAKENKLEKWQRILIEACKQCGQNHLPQILPPLSLKEFLQKLSPIQEEHLRLVAALLPNSQKLKDLLPEKQNPTQAHILIGPEGDFTDQEYEEILAASFAPLALGPIILRTDTAALHCLSILQNELWSRF